MQKAWLKNFHMLHFHLDPFLNLLYSKCLIGKSYMGNEITVCKYQDQDKKVVLSGFNMLPWWFKLELASIMRVKRIFYKDFDTLIPLSIKEKLFSFQ